MFTFGFYNSENGDRKYSAEEFGAIFDGIISDGIYSTYKNGLRVMASEYNNKVIVQPGRAWFAHTWCNVDTDTLVDAPAPELTANRNRVDALVIDVNKGTRTNSLVWVTGEPLVNGTADTCVKPTLVDETDHVQHPLCYVFRQGTINTIIQDNITDVRGIHEKTPWITPVTEAFSSEQLLAQWDATFHTWNTTKQAEFIAWMAEQEQTFDIWFAHMKDQLDEDAAGHLQLEIDSLDIRSTGTASASAIAKKEIGFSTNPNSYLTIPGSEYMEQTITIPAGGSLNVDFTNNRIVASSAITVMVSDDGINYDTTAIDGTLHRCRIVYTNPSSDTALSFTVRIYIQ